MKVNIFQGTNIQENSFRKTMSLQSTGKNTFTFSVNYSLLCHYNLIELLEKKYYMCIHKDTITYPTICYHDQQTYDLF